MKSRAAVGYRKALAFGLVLLIISSFVYNVFASGLKPVDGNTPPDISKSDDQELERGAVRQPWYVRAFHILTPLLESSWVRTLVTFGMMLNPFNMLIALGKTALSIGSAIGGAIVRHLFQFDFESVLMWYRNALLSIMDYLSSLMIRLVVHMTPDLNDPVLSVAYRNVHRAIFMLLVPFYALIIVLTGIYAIFTSIEPSKRSRAKKMVESLILSMVMVSVSPAIFQTILNAATAATNMMMTAVFSEIAARTAVPGCGGKEITFFGAFFGSVFAAVMINPGYSLLLIGIAALVFIALLLFLAIRWALVLMFYLIFPLTLFCYYFDYTRNLGGDLLSRTIMWIFAGPIMGLMIAITALIAVNLVTVSFNGGDCGKVDSVTGRNFNIDAGIPPSQSIDENSLEVRADNGELVGGGAKAGFVDGFILFLVLLAGMIGVLAVPLAMTGLMQWVGAGIAASGMQKLAKAEGRIERWKAFGQITTGNYLLGQGSRSLVSSAVQASWARPDAFQQHDQDMIPGGGEIASGARSLGSRALGRVSGGRWGTPPAPPSPGGRLGAIGRRAAAPWVAMGGLIKNAFDATGAGPREMRDRALEDFTRTTGGSFIIPGVGRVSGTGGGSGGGGGAGGGAPARLGGGGGGGTAGMPPDTIDTKDDDARSMTSSPIHGSSGIITGADGKAILKGTNYYNKGIDSTMSMKPGETWGWVVPVLGVSDRIDSLYVGAGMIVDSLRGGPAGAGVGDSVRSAGRSRMLVQGAGKVLWAVRPISIFFPVRLAGMILYNVTPEVFPPIVQPYAYWMGRRMAGVGLRSMYANTVVKGQLYNLERQFASAETADERERIGMRYSQMLDDIGFHPHPVTKQTNHEFYVNELAGVQRSSPALFDFYMENSRPRIEGNVRDDVEGLTRDWSKYDKKKHETIFGGLMYHMGYDVTDPAALSATQRTDIATAVAGLDDEGVRRIAAGRRLHEAGYESTEDKERALSRIGGGNEDVGVRSMVRIEDRNSDGRSEVYVRKYFSVEGGDLEAAVGNEVIVTWKRKAELMQQGLSEEEATRIAGGMNLKLWRSGTGKTYIESTQLGYVRTKRKEDNPDFNGMTADRLGVGLKRNGRVRVITGYDQSFIPQPTYSFIDYEDVYITRLSPEEKVGGHPQYYTDAAGNRHLVERLGNQANIIEGDSAIIVRTTDGRYVHLGQWRARGSNGVEHEFLASDFSDRKSVKAANYDAERSDPNMDAIIRREGLGETRRQYNELTRDHYFRPDDISELRNIHLSEGERARIRQGFDDLVADATTRIANTSLTSSAFQGERESEMDFAARLARDGLAGDPGEINRLVTVNRLHRIGQNPNAVNGYIENLQQYGGVLGPGGAPVLDSDSELLHLGFDATRIGNIRNSRWTDEQIYGTMNTTARTVDNMNRNLSPVDRVSLMQTSMYYNPDDANAAVVQVQDGKVFVQVNGAYADRLRDRRGVDPATAVATFQGHLQQDIIPHEIRHEYAMRRQGDLEEETLAGMSASQQADYRRLRGYYGDAFSGAFRESVANAMYFESDTRGFFGQNDRDGYLESVGETLTQMQDYYSGLGVLRRSDLANMAQLEILADRVGPTGSATAFDDIARKLGPGSPGYVNYQRMKRVAGGVFDDEIARQQRAIP